MSSDSMDPAGLSQQEKQCDWRERFQRAQQSVFPDLGIVSSAYVKCLIAHHAERIGCREESLFVLLLTCCSSLMGVNTVIKVHECWSEPAILWTIVGAVRGSGKTAILKQLIRPLLELQCEHERQWHLSRPTTSESGATASSKAPPKLLAGATTLQELYKILEKNGGQMLTLDENVENIHNRLLTDSDGSLMQGLELHNLYDAMPSFSSIDGDVSIMTTTCYNHGGMAQPEYIMQLFRNPRLHLLDRYLIVCPDDTPGILHSNVSSSSTKAPTIKSIFQTLYMFHRQFREYVFSAEALGELGRFREEEWASLRTQFSHEENTRLAIDKCPGQIVRLACVLRALMNACVFASQTTGLQLLQWDLAIDKDTVMKAIHLQRYFIEQKLILMHGMSMVAEIPILCAPSTSLQVQSTSQSPLAESSVSSYAEMKSPPILADCPESYIPDFVAMSLPQFIANFSNKIRRLLEYTDDGNGIPASVAAQYSIPPIVHIPGSSNRKPTWVAELFFKKVAELSIGRLCYVKHHANRKYFLRFRRKRPQELTDKDRKLLDTLRVNMELYYRIGSECLAAEMILSPVEGVSSPFMVTGNYLEPSPVTSRLSAEPVHSMTAGLSIKREIVIDDSYENPHSSNS